MKDSVSESSSLPMLDAAPHVALCEAKSYSDESSHMISKSSHPIGRTGEGEEERAGRMEVDLGDECEEVIKVNKLIIIFFILFLYFVKAEL